MEGALPENDGMQSLRQQLLQIKELALSTEEKAKLLQRRLWNPSAAVWRRLLIQRTPIISALATSS
jgi:hypothetical protein